MFLTSSVIDETVSKIQQA